MRRIGKFCIDDILIKKELVTLQKAFAYLGIVPVRTEMLYHKMAIEYYAFSPFFDEVAEHEKVP
jgi:hypothetical protein